MWHSRSVMSPTVRNSHRVTQFLYLYAPAQPPCHIWWTWVVFFVDAQRLQRLCLGLAFFHRERIRPKLDPLSHRDGIPSWVHAYLFIFFCFLHFFLAFTPNVSPFTVIDKPKERDAYLFLMISSQSRAIKPPRFVPLPAREVAHSQRQCATWLHEKLFLIFYRNDVSLLSGKQAASLRRFSSACSKSACLCLHFFFWKLIFIRVLHMMMSDGPIKLASR